MEFAGPMFFGFVVGIGFMRVMTMFAMRDCCEKHFLTLVKGDFCKQDPCKGTPNHYGWCNLHYKRNKI